MTFSLFRAEESADRLLPRGVRLRRATADDEQATFETMRRAMGHDMNWMQHQAMRYHLRTAPHSSYWVAEEHPRFSRPRILGYAHSMVRDRVWSLTEFFVQPAHHRQGIGRALLLACLRDGDKAGADTRLVLASHHPGADALYVRKAGCFPRIPMCLLSGPAANLHSVPDFCATTIQDERLPTSLTSPAQWFTPSLHPPEASALPRLIASPFVLTPDVQEQLDRLDREIVGYARPSEHLFWTAEAETEAARSDLLRISERPGEQKAAQGPSRLFRDARGGKIVGYVHFGTHFSGPALATSPRLLPSMIVHVLRVARHQAPDFTGMGLVSTPDAYWAVAGTNEVMLHWLLDCGWQIVFHYLFMSTRPIGQMDRYVCHNPLYML